ncbi:MAG TPA: hypothetical protein VF884_06990 [Nitrososphaeraceae archaeon]
MRNENDIRELAYAKAELVGRAIPEYSKFIKKWLVYGKQKFNPKITSEANSILVEAFVEMMKHSKLVSPRRLDTLFNLSKARARLLLKDVVDVEDATAVVYFYSQMAKDYEIGTIAPKDPVEVAVEQCLKALEERALGQPLIYTIPELLIKACSASPQVDKYLKSGLSKKDYFDRSNNKRARIVYERLMNKFPEIQITSKNPTKVMLPAPVNKNSTTSLKDSDQSDQSDRTSERYYLPVKNTLNEQQHSPFLGGFSSNSRSKGSEESNAKPIKKIPRLKLVGILTDYRKACTTINAHNVTTKTLILQT